MSCREWDANWVAHLYGELEASEERALHAHLDGCPQCRETLEGLRRTQVRLREAPLAVPPAPRVMVLDARPLWVAGWGFAAGSLAALLVIGAALWIARQAGPARLAPETALDHPAATGPATSSTDPLAARLAALDARLSHVETAPATPGLTPADLRNELARFERRLDRERADELDYLLQSITASELRTGTWIDQTQSALHLLASRQEPEIREQ